MCGVFWCCIGPYDGAAAGRLCQGAGLDGTGASWAGAALLLSARHLGQGRAECGTTQAAAAAGRPSEALAQTISSVFSVFFFLFGIVVQYILPTTRARCILPNFKLTLWLLVHCTNVHVVILHMHMLDTCMASEIMPWLVILQIICITRASRVPWRHLEAWQGTMRGKRTQHIVAMLILGMHVTALYKVVHYKAEPTHWLACNHRQRAASTANCYPSVAQQMNGPTVWGHRKQNWTLHTTITMSTWPEDEHLWTAQLRRLQRRQRACSATAAAVGTCLQNGGQVALRGRAPRWEQQQLPRSCAAQAAIGGAEDFHCTLPHLHASTRVSWWYVSSGEQSSWSQRVHAKLQNDVGRAWLEKTATF